MRWWLLRCGEWRGSGCVWSGGRGAGLAGCQIVRCDALRRSERTQGGEGWQSIGEGAQNATGCTRTHGIGAGGADGRRAAEGTDRAAARIVADGRECHICAERTDKQANLC